MSERPVIEVVRDWVQTVTVGDMQRWALEIADCIAAALVACLIAILVGVTMALVIRKVERRRGR